MLTRCRSALRFAARRAFTLFEMLLVLVLTGLVLGIVTSVGTRLQRQLSSATTRIEGDERLSAAAALLPLDLRALAPAAGDIRASEARDSSLEIRATILTGVACSGTPSESIVAPFLLAGGRHASPSIEPGDTLWQLADGDSMESWRPLSIRSVRSATANCAPFDALPATSVLDLDHLIAVAVNDSSALPSGAVVRVTRPLRYSIYRAGDGLWYLGLRTWNSSIAAFNGVQPLSGPYTAAGPAGTRIEYADSAGNPLAPGMSETGNVARIEWVLHIDSRPGSLDGADSMRVVIAMRNRR